MIDSQEISKIAFDFDGVLVDSNEIKRDCFLKVASLYGEPIREQFNRYCENHPSETRFEKMCWLSRTIGETVDVTYEELVDQYTYCVRAALLHANCVETLEELKKKTLISHGVLFRRPQRTNSNGI